MRPLILAIAMTVASSAAYAQGIALGEPTYGGTGCPQGTANAVLSANATALSIFYDAYQAEAGGPSGRTFDRKSCNLGIPVTVPSGFSVSVLAVDYRGFNGLPAGASSVFRVEYFFAGGQGPVFTRTFAGPQSQDFYIRNNVTAVVWSACGEDVILRTNSSIRVTTRANRLAVATVDTEDIDAAIIYRLQVRRC